MYCTQENRVVSFSRGSAEGVTSAVNKWFKDNTDGKNDDSIWVSSVNFYFDGSQHNAILRWYKEVEVEETP